MAVVKKTQQLTKNVPSPQLSINNIHETIKEIKFEIANISFPANFISSITNFVPYVSKNSRLQLRRKTRENNWFPIGRKELLKFS